MDSLEERVKQFFVNAKKFTPEQLKDERDKISAAYYRALEDADEKVNIANQIFDLVERYLRKLDQELQKFKIELEADNAGITEVLEKRKFDKRRRIPIWDLVSTSSELRSLKFHGSSFLFQTGLDFKKHIRFQDLWS